MYHEYYPDGRLKCEYSGGRADDGRFLLHGQERWYYPSGALMMECCYSLGNRIGSYIYYGEGGTPIWEWEYKPEGLAVYRTFHAGEINSCLRSVAAFRNRFAEGYAQTFAHNGELLKEAWYERGRIVRVTDLRKEIPAPIGKELI
jgi:antitoxin component YwqK of YwqJK toxin-antitoxin module